MCEALDDHGGSVSIGGRLITNFRFADDIDVNAEEEEEAGVLVDRLDTNTTLGIKWRLVQTRRKWRRLPKRDQDKRSEDRSSGGLQVPRIIHL